MRILNNIKKGAKSYMDQYKKRSNENKKYREELNKAVKEARREAYKEEAKKQAILKARMDAKRRFNPSIQQRSKNRIKTVEEVMRDLPQ